MTEPGTCTKLGWQSSARHFGPPRSSNRLILFIGPTGHLTKPSGGTDLKKLKGLVLVTALLGVAVVEPRVAGAAAADPGAAERPTRGGPSAGLMAHHRNNNNIMDLIYMGREHRLDVNSPDTYDNFPMTHHRRTSQFPAGYPDYDQGTDRLEENNPGMMMMMRMKPQVVRPIAEDNVDQSLWAPVDNKIIKDLLRLSTSRDDKKLMEVASPGRSKLLRRKRYRDGGCMFHAGLAHNCDFKDLVGAVNEMDYWGSAVVPGKRRKRSLTLPNYHQGQIAKAFLTWVFNLKAANGRR